MLFVVAVGSAAIATTDEEDEKGIEAVALLSANFLRSSAEDAPANDNDFGKWCRCRCRCRCSLSPCASPSARGAAMPRQGDEGEAAAAEEEKAGQRLSRKRPPAPAPSVTEDPERPNESATDARINDDPNHQHLPAEK